MKIWLLISIFILTSIAVFAQAKNTLPAISQPQFFALSVANLDESVKWYQNNLGLSVAKTINSPDGAIRIAILQSKDLMVELIQAKESVTTRTCNPKPKDEYLVQGIFKVGFFVQNLDDTTKELIAKSRVRHGCNRK